MITEKYTVFLAFFCYLLSAYSQSKPNTVELSPSPLLDSSLYSEHSLSPDKALLYDSLSLDSSNVFSEISDTTLLDTASQDTASINSNLINSPVTYGADDSLIIDLRKNRMYLYSGASLKYQQTDLSAGYISIDFTTREATANKLNDSTDMTVPKLIDNGQEIEFETLRYNFSTQKAILNHSATNYDEGVMQGERIKMVNDSIYFIKRGKYTTCNLEHPHFYLSLSHAKMSKNNGVISGPAYLVMEDVPLYPIGLPFFYNPQKDESNKSGILFPSFGQEEARGFYLDEMGLFLYLNDYVTATFTGGIFSNGTWNLQQKIDYTKRYRYKGNLQFSLFNQSRIDDAGSVTTEKQYKVTASHSQDAKANPYLKFSVSANFSTSSYDADNTYEPREYLGSQQNSNISLTKTFPNSNVSFTGNLRLSQNTKDTTVNFNLPSLSTNVGRIFPFKRKYAVGAQKWYEQISVSYSNSFTNNTRGNIKQYLILEEPFEDNFIMKVNHRLPIALPSFSLPLLSVIKFSPSINYNTNWNFEYYDVFYDMQTNKIEKERQSGFLQDYTYSASLGASTTLFGFLNLKQIFGRKIWLQNIRNVMNWSASLSYTPDLTSASYFSTFIDQNNQQVTYNRVTGAHGVNSKESLNSSFSVSGNIEAKHRAKVDGKEDLKTISIIKNYSLSSSYNLLADSMNLSNISMNLSSAISKISFNLSGTLDPYLLDESGRRTKHYVWSNGEVLPRLTSMNFSTSFSFNSPKGQKRIDEMHERFARPDFPVVGSYEDYIDFDMPWNIAFSYTLSYRKPGLEDGELSHSLSMNASIKLTDNWDVSGSSGYDFKNQDFTYTSINITRNLHCWGMSLSLIPLGDRKSYHFTINANASVLQDLKLQRRQSWFDNR